MVLITIWLLGFKNQLITSGPHIIPWSLNSIFCRPWHHIPWPQQQPGALSSWRSGGLMLATSSGWALSCLITFGIELPPPFFISFLNELYSYNPYRIHTVSLLLVFQMFPLTLWLFTYFFPWGVLQGYSGPEEFYSRKEAASAAKGWVEEKR